MSTYSSEGVKDLTPDERILHHHAAILKKDLEAYHACSRSRDDWNDLFKIRLVRFILVIYPIKPSQIHPGRIDGHLCRRP
jgi:hypothetical protein